MIGYIAGFVLSLVTAGIVSLPTDKELKYTFGKASNYEELAKIYEDTLNKKSDLTMEKDYVKLLLFIKDKKAEQKAEAYLQKIFDLEIAERLIGLLFYAKKPQKCEYWLSKAFEITKNEKYILKKLELGFAFQKFVLDKRSFIAEIKTVATQKNQRILEKATGYFASKKDYEAYIAIIEIAFALTKNPDYSKKLADAYGFVGSAQKQKKELARYFELTKDFAVLGALYGMGETEYAKTALETNIATLPKSELILLKNIYLWNNDEDNYYTLIKSHFLLSELEAQEIHLFATIAISKGDIRSAKTVFDALIAKEKTAAIAIEAAETMEYAGKPEEALAYYDIGYKLSRNPQIADRLIAMAYAIGELGKGLMYEKQKAFNEKNVTALKNLVFKKASSGDESGAFADVKEYLAIDEKTESIELYATVSAMLGFDEQAKKALLKLPPHSLKKESLYVFVNSALKTEEEIGYLKRYYQESNDTAALKRVGEFAATKSSSYLLAIFESFLGAPTQKNTPLFLEYTPIALRGALSDEMEKKTKDEALLNALGLYWLANENVAKAKTLFIKTLSLDRKNLIALEYTAKIESWNNNPQKALEYFLEYDAISPQNPEISYYIAELYKILQKPTHSTKYYHIAVNGLNRSDAAQNVMYIKSVAALRSVEFVKNEFEKVAKASGDTQLYADYIESLYHAKKYDILNSEFKDFEQKSVKNVRLQKLYAYTMIDLGRYKDALTALDGAQKILDTKKERDASISFDRGYLYEKMNEPINAITAYNIGLRIDPSNKNAIEAKSALLKRVAGYAETGYSVQGDIPIKTVGVSIPIESIRVGAAFQDYYGHKMLYATIEDIERKKFFAGAGNSYLHARYTLDAGIIGVITAEAKSQKSREYKEAIKKSLGYQSYGFYLDKKFSQEFSFSSYYQLRDYVLDGSLAAKASLYDIGLQYRLRDKLVLFYRHYAHNIKSRFVDPSVFSFDNYTSDDIGVYTAYDFSHRLAMSLSGGVSLVNDKAQPFASLGVTLADMLTLGISGSRDTFTGELQKLFEVSLRYKY